MTTRANVTLLQNPVWHRFSENVFVRFFNFLQEISWSFLKKQRFCSFLWKGFDRLKTEDPLNGGSLLLITMTPGFQFRALTYGPRKDERLSFSWRDPVVLNSGTLDWWCSVLTTWKWKHELMVFRKNPETFSPPIRCQDIFKGNILRSDLCPYLY